jgi:hypothetical protein
MERLGNSRRPWALLAAVALATAPSASRAQGTPVEQLQKDLESMRKQMQQMQKRLEEQDAVIRKLSKEPAAPAAATAEAPAPAPPAPPPPVVAKAPEPWSPTAPIKFLSGSRGYLSLSFDGIVDAGWSTAPDVTTIETGDHDPLQRGFTIPNGEIFLNGAVDPYFTGATNIVFKLDEDNETDVELEEMWLQTSSLPWNLQVKGGQYLTEFGRFNQQHPHAWDFVDQQLVIGRMFGPEGLRNPGARVSWLLPLPFYSELLGSVQNSNGETAYSFRDTEVDLFGRTPIERNVRGPGDLLYTPRWVSSFDLTDSQTVVAGLSGAFGPNASGRSNYTQIYGGDLYWKWKPSWQSGGFPFVAFQTEALGRRYEAGASNGLPAEVLYDWGLYGQALYGFTQRWVAGLRAEWVSGDTGAFKDDPNRSDRFRTSPDLTFYPTEFSKLRLQYNYDHGQLNGDDSSVWVQVEFLLGDHAAHKF